MNDKGANLQYSKSAEFLHSRLVAEVKVSSTSANKSSMGLSVKPRMHNSKSSPFVGLASNLDLSKEILPSPAPKTLENNSKANIGRQSVILGATANSTISNMMGQSAITSESKGGDKYATSMGKKEKNTQDTQIATNFSSYGIDSHGFISSLNLSSKQLFDLYKVPQTFFYLAQNKMDDYNSADLPIKTMVPSTDLDSDHGSSADVDSSNEFLMDARNYNPSVYDLKPIALDQVDKNHYFTLSKEGITQFRNKISTFTSLVQWEREYKLYHKIANIQFFKLYKRWKVCILDCLLILNVYIAIS